MHVVVSWHNPARIPGILFAAIDAPTPSPAEQDAALGLVLAQRPIDCFRIVGIIHRPDAVGAEVEHLATLTSLSRSAALRLR